MRNARALHIFEVLGELQQVFDLLGGEVEQTEERTTRKINTHFDSFLGLKGEIPSLSLMQALRHSYRRARS